MRASACARAARTQAKSCSPLAAAAVDMAMLHWQLEGGMLASRRKRATASGKQWRKKCAATILGEVHAARAVVPGRARWQRRGHTQAVRLGDAMLAAGGMLTRLARGSVPRLLASSGGKGTQPRFWARCMRLEPLCGGARAGNGEARTQAVRQTGKSCMRNGCCMISLAGCTLPMRAGWCVAGLPGHNVSTAGNVRFKAMHTLCPGKAATLSSLAAPRASSCGAVCF